MAIKKQSKRGIDRQDSTLVQLAGAALKHSQSCKKCKKESCPLGIDLAAMLRLAKEKKINEAKACITKATPILSICSTLCPAPCQNCQQAKIQDIVKLIADSADELPKQKAAKRKSKTVAVIGGGPSGLTGAYHLAKKGYAITLFDALTELGGFLNFKIPDFRLPRHSLKKDIANVIALPNIEVNLKTIVGHAFGIPMLAKKFDAVLVCTGANKPAFMQLPGESLLNVYTASEFLSGHGNSAGEETIVIGGGNSAIDAARHSRRLGANTTILYRRTVNEMPADGQMIKKAIEEGVKFLFLTKPLRLIGTSKVEGIECEQLRLGEPDFDGRKRPIPIEESNFQLACDRVIIAVGAEPNPSMGKTRTIRTIGKERVWVDENYMTSIEGVFAAGDVIKNDGNIIPTIKSAIEAAEKIDGYLKDI